MAIRHWTVVTERVSDKSTGLATYMQYLANNNHKNHKKTVIQEITNNGPEFFAFTAKNAMEKDLQSRGKRVASYAQGFNLTLPNEFQPNATQWKKIYFEVRDALKTHLNLTNESFYCNLHEEPTKNSHLNLLVSRCNDGGKLNVELDKYSTLGLVKKTFTQAVLKHCNISTENYVKKSKSPKKSRRLSSSEHNFKLNCDREKEKEFIKSLDKYKEFNKLVEGFKDIHHSLELAKAVQKSEDIATHQKLILNVPKPLQQAVEVEETKEIKPK